MLLHQRDESDLQTVASQAVNPARILPQNRKRPNPPPLTVRVEDPVDARLPWNKALILATLIEIGEDDVPVCLPRVIEARRLSDLERIALPTREVSEIHTVAPKTVAPTDDFGVADLLEKSCP